ncbi:hypothetical protein J0H58_18140 [bacterium]|nr:hypothetical protein [bacterium]
MTGRPHTAARRLAVLAAALALAPGCKSREGSTGGGSAAAPRPDPLVAGPGRIPRQNIPLPDRGTGTAGKTKADPLLGSPGPACTPAALTARAKDDGFGLKIDSPGGTPLTPASGTATAATEQPPDVAPLYAQLKGFGVERVDYTVTREGERFLFQARVPIGNGAVRGYSGAGATEADAMRQVLDQIRLDRGTK